MPSGQYVAELFIAALPAGTTPPRGFRRVGSDEALHLLEVGIRHIPDASPDPKTGGRFRPVSTSPGWVIPKDEKPPVWRREGESALPAEDVRELAAAAGIASPSKGMAPDAEDVDEPMLWSEASAGGPANAWHFAFLIQPDESKKPRKPDTILQRFRWWRWLLRNYPIAGPNVRRELAARTDRPPRAADAEALTVAAERDVEDRRRADEFEAECERMAAENRRLYGAEWMADLEFNECPHLREFFGLSPKPRRRRPRTAASNVESTPQYAAFMATAGCHTKRT